MTVKYVVDTIDYIKFLCGNLLLRIIFTADELTCIINKTPLCIIVNIIVTSYYVNIIFIVITFSTENKIYCAVPPMYYTYI